MPVPGSQCIYWIRTMPVRWMNCHRPLNYPWGVYTRGVIDPSGIPDETNERAFDFNTYSGESLFYKITPCPGSKIINNPPRLRQCHLVKLQSSRIAA